MRTSDTFHERSALLSVNEQSDSSYGPNMAQSIEGFLSEIKKGNFLLEERKPLSWKTVINSLSVGSGLLSGIPWISPSMDAAIIIPNPGVLRKTVAIIFAAGIVLTVGADGGYVMYDCLPLEESKRVSEIFFDRNDNKIKTAIVGIFSVLACTSPIYATVTYNTGINRFLSILTAVTSLGYGVYGYKRLVNKSSNFILDYLTLDESGRVEKKRYNKSLYQLLRSIEKDPEILLGNDDLSEIVNGAIRHGEIVNSNMNRTAAGKLIFQLMGDITIPAATALVTVILAKEAMQTIWDNPAFYITMTILAELPSYILNLVSTHNIFGQVFDGILGIINGAPDNSFLNLTYPKTMLAFNVAAAIIALTAPSAAAYITYTTIGKFSDLDVDSMGDVDSIGSQSCISPDCLNNGFITWGSVAAISLARYILSVFTQKRLLSEAMLALACNSSDDGISSRANISKSVGKVLESWDNLEPKDSVDYAVSEKKPDNNKKESFFSYYANSIQSLTFFGETQPLESIGEDHKSICILQ